MKNFLRLPLFLIGPCLLAESPIEFEKHVLTTNFYTEGAAVADVNNDGNLDVLAGPYWYAGPAFTIKQEIYEPKAINPKGYSHNFLSWAYDVNGDGWTDYVVAGWPGKEGYWHENPKGGEGRWPRHVYAKVVDNESPRFIDVTGDKKPEMVCSQGGTFGYFEPGENPTRLWDWREISPPKATGGKYTHGLGMGDVNGDGRMDILEKNGWWEQPEKGGKWISHPYPFAAGKGGSQMYVYDFDGDGDGDVLTALDAHGYGIAWYEQVSHAMDFLPHKIIGTKPEDKPYGVSFSQPHSIELVDMDGDGLKDVVTGKRWWAHGGRDPGGNEAAVLYWFRTQRVDDKVRFTPYLIDNDSGVGTQVTVHDLNGDKKPDIVVGNKKGTFVHLQK